VFTDRVIEGCECYDAQSVRETQGWFKLIYLKLGISKLLFDYFIWLDADHWFVRNPRNVLDCLGKSVIHVPLTANLSAMQSDGRVDGISAAQYRELMTRAGVLNAVYMSRSPFWIVHHDAIGKVCELADAFRLSAFRAGFTVGVSAALGYAMQMLCADPESHQLSKRGDLWASDGQDHFQGRLPDGRAWSWEDPVSGETCLVNPSIVHLPHRKTFKTDSFDACKPAASATEPAVVSG
jgi:hypothetical protein